MTQKIERKIHTIDATDQTLGRLATRVATLLQGKHKAAFKRHLDIGDIVVVENAGAVVVTGNKLIDKRYYRHSGYLGNLKETTLKDMLQRKPGEALRLAVFGMLPKNRLRARMMTRLTLKGGKTNK